MQQRFLPEWVGGAGFSFSSRVVVSFHCCYQKVLPNIRKHRTTIAKLLANNPKKNRLVVESRCGHDQGLTNPHIRHRQPRTNTFATCVAHQDRNCLLGSCPGNSRLGLALEVLWQRRPSAAHPPLGPAVPLVSHWPSSFDPMREEMYANVLCEIFFYFPIMDGLSHCGRS